MNEVKRVLLEENERVLKENKRRLEELKENRKKLLSQPMVKNTVDSIVDEICLLYKNDLIDIIRFYDKMNLDCKVFYKTQNYIKNKQTNSFVYFIRDPRTKLTKIGCTSNLEQRIKTINKNISKSSDRFLPVEIIMLIETSFLNQYSVEKYFHEKYKDKRKFEEWFDLSKKDIKNLYRNFNNDEIDESIYSNNCCSYILKNKNKTISLSADDVLKDENMFNSIFEDKYFTSLGKTQGVTYEKIFNLYLKNLIKEILDVNYMDDSFNPVNLVESFGDFDYFFNYYEALPNINTLKNNCKQTFSNRLKEIIELATEEEIKKNKKYKKFLDELS